MSKTQLQKTEDTAREPDGPDALSAKQDLVLRALLSHPTYKEAAKAVGVGGIDLICCARMLRHRVRLRVVMLTAADCEREARRVGSMRCCGSPKG